MEISRNTSRSVSSGTSFFGILFRKPFTFQKMTFFIASLILVVLIILVSYTFFELNQSRQFPPNVPECPDYFEVKGDNICFNKKNLGSCGRVTHDFNSNEYKGTNGLKKKLKWAHDCNVVWDGITNNSDLTKI